VSREAQFSPTHRYDTSYRVIELSSYRATQCYLYYVNSNDCVKWYYSIRFELYLTVTM